MNLSEVRLLEDFFGVGEKPERRDLDQNAVIRGWKIAKRITLIVLLAGAFMFYYLIDRLQQGLSAF